MFLARRVCSSSLCLLTHLSSQHRFLSDWVRTLKSSLSQATEVRLCEKERVLSRDRMLHLHVVGVGVFALPHKTVLNKQDCVASTGQCCTRKNVSQVQVCFSQLRVVCVVRTTLRCEDTSVLCVLREQDGVTRKDNVTIMILCSTHWAVNGLCITHSTLGCVEPKRLIFTLRTLWCDGL